MKVKFGLVLIALILLNLGLVSAEIMLSQPNAVYNFGDNLKVQATISSTRDVSGFFELNLNCGVEKNFYRQYLNLKQSQQKVIEAEILLLPSFTAKGICNVKATFNGESKETPSFSISNDIKIELIIRESDVEAGKNVIISGNGVKENGQGVVGFAELLIDNASIKSESSVNNNFSLGFAFPSNAKSQAYSAQIRVYEKLGEELLNEGYSYTILNVLQTPKEISITSPDSVMPGNNLKYNVVVLDQAGDIIDKNVNVKFIKDKFSTEKTFFGDDEIGFDLNATPGIWQISASYLNLQANKNIDVLVLEKASFDIVDGTLIVKNIGNVQYQKTIQVKIGDVTESKNVALEIGDEIRFKLNAPDGSYDVQVSDGNQEVSKNVVLTGRTVSVRELGSGFGFISRYPIVWVFLILVCGTFIILFGRKVIKRTSYSVPLEKEERAQTNEKGYEIMNIAQKHPEKAEHSLVLEGKREEASFLSIKILDMERIKKVCSETMGNIIRLITDNKGSVYEANNFVIGVFSPSTTKKIKNELNTIKVARQIETILKAHNNKYREKINYGLGVSVGDIISRTDDKLKFNAIGNSISAAKRIAEISSGELFISENANKKIVNEARTERKVVSGMNVYTIKNIMDRDKNQDFIQNFLDRQKK